MTPPDAAPAPPKAEAGDFRGRFREIVSDPLNLLIERVPDAGRVVDGLVHLHNGVRVPIEGEGAYYGAFSDVLEINRGVHEPLEEYVFQRLLARLPAEAAMIELGAYWGHYSMWLKRARPGARVWLVEPEAANLAAGRANFARNGLEGAFVQAFVGAGALTVDGFMTDRGLTRLDVLHSDIQGYEVEMLEGARGALATRAVDHLLISTHGDALHRDVYAALAGHGYRVEASSDFETETTSFDGFVYASSPRLPPLLPGFRPMTRPEICTASPAERMRRLTEWLERATDP